MTVERITKVNTDSPEKREYERKLREWFQKYKPDEATMKMIDEYLAIIKDRSIAEMKVNNLIEDIQ